MHTSADVCEPARADTILGIARSIGNPAFHRLAARRTLASLRRSGAPRRLPGLPRRQRRAADPGEPPRSDPGRRRRDRRHRHACRPDDPAAEPARSGGGRAPVGSPGPRSSRIGCLPRTHPASRRRRRNRAGRLSAFGGRPAAPRGPAGRDRGRHHLRRPRRRHDPHPRRRHAGDRHRAQAPVRRRRDRGHAERPARAFRLADAHLRPDHPRHGRDGRARRDRERPISCRPPGPGRRTRSARRCGTASIRPSPADAAGCSDWDLARGRMYWSDSHVRAARLRAPRRVPVLRRGQRHGPSGRRRPLRARRSSRRLARPRPSTTISASAAPPAIGCGCAPGPS